MEINCLRLRVARDLTRAFKSVLAASVALAFFGFLASANANLVVNGGFETGDFSGWTLTGNTVFSGVECPGSALVFEGNCDAFFGPTGSTGGITQTLTGLTVGALYTESFAFR